MRVRMDGVTGILAFSPRLNMMEDDNMAGGRDGRMEGAGQRLVGVWMGRMEGCWWEQRRCGMIACHHGPFYR